MSALSRFEWLVLAVALLLCPGFSWGQQAPDASAGASAPAASLFDRLDRNRDGYLSPAELESAEARNRNWIAVDRDRDGRISRSEFGLVGISKPEPSAAAAGATSRPKPE
jgi:hypothetical protein